MLCGKVVFEMKRSRALFRLAAALLLSGSILSLALLLALLAVPAVSALCSLLARRQLKLSLSGPVNCAKGQRAAVSVTVENGSALPLPAIGLWLEVKNLLTGETQTVLRRTGALPRGRGCAQVELSSRFCGRVQVRVQRVRLYDCFWLIPVRCGATAAAAFTVQPDTFPLEVTILADAGCPEDSEVYSQEKPGADLTETFQVRDYREGDSIRRWWCSGSAGALPAPPGRMRRRRSPCRCAGRCWRRGCSFAQSGARMARPALPRRSGAWTT